MVGKDENPVDPSPAVRAKALDRIKWGIDRAHDMNAKILCGPFHSAHGVFTKQPPQQIEYALCAEVLNAAGEHAKDNREYGKDKFFHFSYVLFRQNFIYK